MLRASSSFTSSRATATRSCRCWCFSPRPASPARAAVAAIAVFCNWPILSTTLMRAVTETNVGTALQSDGRLDEAVDHYPRAITLAPEFPPAYNNLATTLRAQGNVAGAIATYQQ